MASNTVLCVASNTRADTTRLVMRTWSVIRRKDVCNWGFGIFLKGLFVLGKNNNENEQKWRRNRDTRGNLLRNGSDDEHVAGHVTAAGLQNPAMAVWCRPGPRHTSQVRADSGQALPSEHSHDQ